MAALAEENKVALAAAIAEERAQGVQERETVLQDCRAEIQREVTSAQASANEQLAVQAKEHTEVLQRAADARTAAVKVRCRRPERKVVSPARKFFSGENDQSCLADVRRLSKFICSPLYLFVFKNVSTFLS